MSSEERIVKQLEGIVTAMIEALESLEEKFADFIENTNNRLEKLEYDINRLKSQSKNKQQGLTKAEDTNDISIKDTNSIKNDEIIKAKSQEMETELSNSPVVKVDGTLSNVSSNSNQDLGEPPTEYKLPPIPIPPTIEKDITPPATKIKEKESITSAEQSSVQNNAIKASSKKEFKDFEDEDDKKELISALEVIDSL